MKRPLIILIFACLTIYISCTTEGESEFTGNEVSIPMIAAGFLLLAAAYRDAFEPRGATEKKRT